MDALYKTGSQHKPNLKFKAGSEKKGKRKHKKKQQMGRIDVVSQKRKYTEEFKESMCKKIKSNNATTEVYLSDIKSNEPQNNNLGDYHNNDGVVKFSKSVAEEIKQTNDYVESMTGVKRRHEKKGSQFLFSNLIQNADYRMFTSDVQFFLYYAILKNSCPFNVRWFRLLAPYKITHIVVIEVEGISHEDFTHNKSVLSSLDNPFTMQAEMHNPEIYKSSIDKELFHSVVPPQEVVDGRLQLQQKKLYFEKMLAVGVFKNWPTLSQKMLKFQREADNKTTVKGTGGIKWEKSKKRVPNNVSREQLPAVIKAQIPDQAKQFGLDQSYVEEIWRESITVDMRKYTAMKKQDLVLTREQMTREQIPVVDNKIGIPSGWAWTHEDYTDITDKSPLFGIDCEMCMTVSNKSVLTHVCVVDQLGHTVYETYVKPDEKITNYLTWVSGISAGHLSDVTTTLADVQRDLTDILPTDAIIVGHSICSDMKALQLFHPYFIDTSYCYNLRGIRSMKTKLKMLADIYLQRTIQSGSHDPAEDAKASVDLAVHKLIRGEEYGDIIKIEEMTKKRQLEKGKTSEESRHEEKPKAKIEERKEISEAKTRKRSNVSETEVGSTVKRLKVSETELDSSASDDENKQTPTAVMETDADGKVVNPILTLPTMFFERLVDMIHRDTTYSVALIGDKYRKEKPLWKPKHLERGDRNWPVNYYGASTNEGCLRPISQDPFLLRKNFLSVINLKADLPKNAKSEKKLLKSKLKSLNSVIKKVQDDIANKAILVVMFNGCQGNRYSSEESNEKKNGTCFIHLKSNVADQL